VNIILKYIEFNNDLYKDVGADQPACKPYQHPSTASIDDP